MVHRGRNLLRLPIEERRKLLTEALRKVEYPVIQSIPFTVKPAEVIRAAKELELENVIAKRKGSIYDPSRPRLRYRFLRPSTHHLTATHIP